MGGKMDKTKDLERRLKEISEKIGRAHSANRGSTGPNAQEQISTELAGAKSELENILVELSEVRHGGNED